MEIKMIKKLLAAVVVFFCVSPASYADYIMTIGIKSKLADHLLSNCRVDSSLLRNTTSDNMGMSNPGNSMYGEIIGQRKSADALPNSYRATKMEFDTDKTIYHVFSDNFKYGEANQGSFPAVLTKSITVDEAVDYYVKHHYYNVGMTLFSAIPAGLNAATVYNKGEVVMSFRMEYGGQGQLECDIYDLKGNLIGLVDYFTNDDEDGLFGTMPYGANEDAHAANADKLKYFKLDTQVVHDYGHKYPKKRVSLIISDENVPYDSKQSISTNDTPDPVDLKTYFSRQAVITNKTDDFVFKNCQKADRHGSWKSYPSTGDVIKPDQYFEFGMKSKGNGIQGVINCDVYYQLNGSEPDSLLVAKLLLEMNNDGTVIGLFPYVNDLDVSKKLLTANYKYTLHAENQGNYSFDIFQ